MTKEFIEKAQFGKIDLEDSFFDSLKYDYSGFESWFKAKSNSGEYAYVIYDDKRKLVGFLYLKDECEEDSTIKPNFDLRRRLKIGTFKVNAHNTSLGQRFVMIALREMVIRGIGCAYVTVLPEHRELLPVFEKFGFKKWGKKGKEIVLVKEFKIQGNPYLDYPAIPLNDGHNNFLLSVYPKFHTDLFPDSELNTEKGSWSYKDTAYTNAIEKIYLTRMDEVRNMKYGDKIIIYRTKVEDRSAEYSSVATSVCTLVENKSIYDFENIEAFLKYCHKSIFSEEQLCSFYESKKYPIVLKFLYNFPLKKRIIRKDLINKVGLPRDNYWGCMQITDEEFVKIIRLSLGKEGEGVENFVIDKP